MAQLKAGKRWKSSVCTTEIMVIAAPAEDTALTCGGADVIPIDGDPPADASLSPDFSAGTAMGKRYVNAEGELEVLCTKPGEGSLAANGVPLEIKSAKPLPSSD